MPRQPSLFISHGAPTFALEPGVAGPLLVAAGAADCGDGLSPAGGGEGGVAYGMLAMDTYVFGLAGRPH